MKKIILLLPALIIMMLVGGCGNEISATETVYVFDTVLRITLYGSSDLKLRSSIEETKELLDGINKCASAHDSESELYRLNETAYNADIAVSDTLYELIDTGLYYSELTDGAFDITLGKLSSEWAIGTENSKVPDLGFIESNIGKNGWKSVITDNENHTVRYTDDGVSIDLGGIAKGYAAQRVKEYLLSQGVSKGILDFGGNIVTLGRKSENSLWNIGIKNPVGEGVSATISCEDSAVVTSGNYERVSVIDGVSYHHILDGKTGYPADSGVASATIITSDSTAADCLSTAVFVLGEEKGLELIESIDGAEAVIIGTDMSVSVSSGINKDITVTL